MKQNGKLSKTAEIVPIRGGTAKETTRSKINQ